MALGLTDVLFGAALTWIISKFGGETTPAAAAKPQPAPPPPTPTPAGAPAPTLPAAPASSAPSASTAVPWPKGNASTIPQHSYPDSKKEVFKFAPIITSTAEPQTEERAVAAREKKPFDGSYWMVQSRPSPEEVWKANALLKEWQKGRIAFDGPRTFQGRRQYRAVMHGKKKSIEVWRPKPPFV